MREVLIQVRSQTVNVFANRVRGCALRHRGVQFIVDPKQVAMFSIDWSEKNLVLRAPCDSPHTNYFKMFQSVNSKQAVKSSSTVEKFIGLGSEVLASSLKLIRYLSNAGLGTSFLLRLAHWGAA
jgi:hypothetical protein